ncbi:uncharacterized protein LOC123683460 [Harmonia axyridis]|uniref:uncharacterized protein LOC123683460 n=1 Tax=Harmonia axyridis TaxID=115357 RepID=UPI001E279D5F|nr:uncharacterized protein LOC123683460 [Harmonia axyridis]
MENFYDYYCKHVTDPWIFHAKKLYNEKVKTDSYEIDLQSRPFDNDIRKPKLDFFLSHHNRFGYDEHLPWITETQDMLSQIHRAEEIPNTNKKLLGYYTYHDQEEIKLGKCPSPYAISEYITTMQNSYKPQRGYITERLVMAQTPFFVNRRFKILNPRESRNQFYDDDHLEEVALLHEYKPPRQLSYNFMTGCMSDGTAVPKNLYTII